MNDINTTLLFEVVYQRWDSLLRKIEQSGNEGIWVEVDEASQQWQDLKEMAQRGIVFSCGLTAGLKKAGWHVHENSMKYFDRFFQFYQLITALRNECV